MKERIINFVGGLFKDSPNSPSMKRFSGFLCVLTLCISFFCSLFSKHTIEPSPILIESLTVLSLGCLGLTSAEKIFVNKNSNNETK